MVTKIYNKPSKSKKKNIVIPVENIGKIDINMPDFCFGIIGKMQVKDQPDSIEICDAFDQNKKIIITRGSFGFPNQSTRDTLMVLMRLAWKKKKLGSRSTPITAYEIFNELGQFGGGTNLKRLKHNLDILQQTQIKHINSFYNKETGESSQGVFAFSILGSYYIKEFGIDAPEFVKTDDKEMWNGHVTWEEGFFKGIMHNGKNLISIDHSKYMSLSKDIAKQLFLFLSKRSYNSNYLQLPLKELARNKLGISETRSLSKIKYDLKDVHISLIKLNILTEEPTYFNNAGVEWIKYTFTNASTVQLLQNQEVDLSEVQEVGNIIESLNLEIKKESLEVGNSGRQEAGNFVNDDGEFIDIELSENMEAGISDNQKDGKSESQEGNLELGETKKRFMELGLTEANYGKMINKYTYQKILDGLDLLNMEIKNGSKIRSKKKWFLACLNQEFDTDSLFADREKVEIETQNQQKLELQILEDKKTQAEKRRLAEQKSKQLEEWMSNNIFEVVDECEKYAKEIIEKGGIMANMLTKTAKENNETISKAILTNPIFAGNVKTRLWARVK